MRTSTANLAALASIVCKAMATEWHVLTYYPPNDQQFISFSGSMLVPRLPSANVYYLWPGLQTTDNSGVYQNVLDGRSGSWYFGSGWCCSNPSLPWGGGFGASEGDVVNFSNYKTANGWTSTTTKQGTGDMATNDFPLGDKNFNQALFAIELDGPSWDFGPLTFTNAVITATGSDTSFCTDNPSNLYGSTDFTISGVNAVVGNGVVDCHIDKVVMNGPK